MHQHCRRLKTDGGWSHHCAAEDCSILTLWICSVNIHSSPLAQYWNLILCTPVKQEMFSGTILHNFKYVFVFFFFRICRLLCWLQTVSALELEEWLQKAQTLNWSAWSRITFFMFLIIMSSYSKHMDVVISSSCTVLPLGHLCSAKRKEKMGNEKEKLPHANIYTVI